MGKLTLSNIKINAVPAQIEFDAAALNQKADEYLEKYEGYTVTKEGLADDKKLAQELGKDITQLGRFRIDTKKQLTEPIAKFEAEIKGVEDKFKSVRELISNQVSKFEAETLTGIEIKLNAYLIEAFEKQGVRNECRKATVEGLVLLGSETATGNLTAKAKTELDTRVWDNLCDQQRDDLRLADMKAKWLAEGLQPLAKQQIQHILSLEDAEYEVKLAEILAAEIDREKQAVEFRARQAERAAQAAEQAAQAVIVEQPAKPAVEIVQDAGDWQILIKFTTPRANFTAEQVRAKLNDKLEECRFRTHEILEIK